MISEIRSYFKLVINEVDSDLKQHNRYFISDDIADTNKEDRYHLYIGNVDTNRQDIDMNSVFAISLKFWKNGDSDEIEKIDKAYCNAILMQLKLMDKKRITQSEFIKSVDGTSIEIEPSINNDNLAEFTLQFNITVGYKSF